MAKKKVVLEERDGTLGKECTKCCEWKALDNYAMHKGKLGGRESSCKICRKKYNKKYYEENQTSILLQKQVYAKENREHRAEYMKKWNEENRDRRKEYNRNYRINNNEQLSNYDKNRYKENPAPRKEAAKNWQQNNPEKLSIIRHRRRARQASLPSTLTANEYNKTLNYFENACALTGRTDNLEKEHALPISIGHGGTTFENCYPMEISLNRSKHNHNIFEWFEANRQRFNLEQWRFDRLIEWLASANAMSTEEYREYVYWCHANPNEIENANADGNLLAI
jgi:hypothetical protein